MSIAFWTVISGTIVFVIGQVLQKFFMQPLVEFNNTKHEVAAILEYYANVINNPHHKDSETAAQKLREVAVKLQTT